MYGQALKPVRAFADGCMQKHSFWRYIPPTKIGRDTQEADSVLHLGKEQALH